APGSSGAGGTTALNATSDASPNSTAWNTTEIASDRGSVSGERLINAFQLKPSMDVTLNQSEAERSDSGAVAGAVAGASSKMGSGSTRLFSPRGGGNGLRRCWYARTAATTNAAARPIVQSRRLEGGSSAGSPEGEPS